MDKERYLEYIRELHARLSKRASQSGVTTWALLGAFAFLLLQLPAVLVKLSREESPQVVVMWAHLQVSVLAAWAFSSTLRGTNPTTQFDYRVRAADSVLGTVTLGVLLLLVPAALSTGALYVSSDLHGWQRLVLLTNAWFYGPLFFLWTAYTTFALISQLTTNLPPIATLLQEKTSIRAVISVALDALTLVLLVSNLYFVFGPWFAAERPTSQSALTLALVLTFIVVILWQLVMTLPMHRSLDGLERLERDIILHNIEVEAIKDRLEREYLGTQLGALLQRRVADLKEQADDLQHFAESAQEKLAEIEHLGADFRHEKEGRVGDLLDSLEPRVRALENHWTGLGPWLKGAYDSPIHDRYLRDLAKKTLAELGAHMARAIGAAKLTLDNIRATREKIKAVSK
jgi:hypothetical protein